MASEPYPVIRVFGEFPWPPSQGAQRSARGTASVVYFEDSPHHFKACIWWDPQPTDNPNGTITPTNQLPDFSDPYTANQTFCVWLDAFGNTALSFFNGWFYEQSSLVEDSGINLVPVAKTALAVDAASASQPTLRVTRTSIQVRCAIPRLTAPGVPAPAGGSPRVELQLLPSETLTSLSGKLNRELSKRVSTSNLHQANAFLSMVGEGELVRHDPLHPYSEDVRVGPEGVRHELNNIDAHDLDELGVLREDAFSLVVAFDKSTRTRIHSHQRHFKLVATTSWPIPIGKFWERMHSGQIAFELLPEVAWNLERGQLASIDVNDISTPWGLLRAADTRTKLGLEAIAGVEGGLLDCALPDSGEDGLAGINGCEVALAYTTIVGDYALGEPITKPLNVAVRPICVSALSPFPTHDRLRIGLRFNASLPKLDQKGQPPIQQTYDLSLVHGVSADTHLPDGSRLLMFFHILERGIPNDKDLRGRVSGLSFEGFNKTLLPFERDTPRSYLAIYLPPDQRSARGLGSRVKVIWEWWFGIGKFMPMRGDVPWGDREDRPVPLLVPPKETPAPTQQDPPFALQVTESISPRDDRHMVCNIRENSLASGAKPEQYTLLSRNPWSALRFARIPLAVSGDEGNAIVATYHSDQRTWLFKLVSPEYHFQFPHQGIGESADKPRYLELHDVNALDQPPPPPPADPHLRHDDVIVNADSSVNFVRPAPKASGNGMPRRSYVVECRYTPSLDLWVKPSDLERGYFLAEWNAAELFRQKNDFGLGVALRALRGEFLYGLPVGVDPSREDGPARLARVAELEALTGILPQRSYLQARGDHDVATWLSNRWQLLRAILMARHERLEVWTPAYDQVRPFVPSRFESGATFGLRTTALLRNPTPTIPPTAIPPGQLRISDDRGLSGGALWPIESRLHWQQLHADPTFHEGRIERIAISPTGGDADQSASFMEGLVTIANETRAGFVQRQRVEILGRIGVFWNCAKHVVIYERTVNPSEQFAPEIDPADPQKWHLSRSRRAVVRKVMEYIELLEPVRSYPDDSTARATSCGFLDSVRIQKIIFVDSAWGREISDPSGAQGYEIPLWDPNAARKRPNVYRFPNIMFVTVGEGKEQRPLVPRQCANPENVYFYAQATPVEGDTNKWAPVFDVDYGRLLDPVEIEKSFAAGGGSHGAPYQGSDEVPSGRKPSPQRVLPGHHRFTWRLLPDSGRTTLNAGYGDKPVFGTIESITFSRNSAAAIKSDAQLEKHKEHAEGIAALSVAPSVLAHHLAELDKLSGEFVGANTTPRQQAAVKTVLEQLEGLQSTLTSASGKLANFGTEAGDIIKHVGLDKNPLNCAELKNRLGAEIRRKLLAVAHEVDAYQDEFQAWATGLVEAPLKTAWDQYNGQITVAKDRLVRAISDVLIADATVGEIIKSLIAEAHTDVHKVLADMERAARVIHDCVADIDVALATAARRLQDIVSTCSKVDWTVTRYDRLREQIREELGNLPLQLNSVAADFSQRLAAELGPAGWIAAAAVSQAFAKELALIIDGLTLAVEVTLVQADPAQIIAPCVTTLQQAQAQLSAFEAKLRVELNNALNAFQTSVNNCESQIQRVVNEVLSCAAVVPALMNSVAIETITQIDTLWTQGNSIVSSGKDLLQELKNRVILSIPRLGELVRSNQTLAQVQASLLDDIDTLCTALSGIKVVEIDPNLVTNLEGCLTPITNAINELTAAANNVAQIDTAIANLRRDFGAVRDACVQASSLGQAYTTRVMEGFSRVFDGSLKSVPSNVLRLMSAATAAPEIAQLQANVDRMRCAYDDAKIQITKVRAALSKLGDALKALGIDIPTDQLSERFEIPSDVLANYDISDLFPNFGGLNLRGLLQNVKVPDAGDAVRISHDFDRKQFRAWVQVDVNYPIKGRKELYSFGPFAVYFRDSSLTGVMRAEATQASDGAQTTARSRIDTHIDVDVGGECMLSLEKVAVHYEQGNGLKFEFDPTSIRLHAALQFVQDTLGSLMGDEIGGLQIIKDKGLPVGLQHVFSLPTISIMAGTSGVSNIQLTNVFQLLAYPEFVITNRFNLSRPELPFIFSFFIVGGTGYVWIEATYRPLDSALTVGVECAAGGSAALGFSFGPVSGSVFISLSLVITYRKTISGGKASGDGLSVSVLLVIAGRVSLWGIVEVFLSIMLRMTYQESGAIDALGSLSVSVKLCRFITLRYSASVQYRLKGGKSETTQTSSTSVDVDRVAALKGKAQKLEGARA